MATACRPMKKDGRPRVTRTSTSVAAGAEFAVQLPVETRPVVDDGPGDEKYAARVCEDSRSRGGSLHLGERGRRGVEHAEILANKRSSGRYDVEHTRIREVRRGLDTGHTCRGRGIQREKCRCRIKGAGASDYPFGALADGTGAVSRGERALDAAMHPMAALFSVSTRGEADAEYQECSHEGKSSQGTLQIIHFALPV